MKLWNKYHQIVNMYEWFFVLAVNIDTAKEFCKLYTDSVKLLVDLEFMIKYKNNVNIKLNILYSLKEEK